MSAPPVGLTSKLDIFPVPFNMYLRPHRTQRTLAAAIAVCRHTPEVSKSSSKYAEIKYKSAVNNTIPGIVVNSALGTLLNMYDESVIF